MVTGGPTDPFIVSSEILGRIEKTFTTEMVTAKLSSNVLYEPSYHPVNLKWFPPAQLSIILRVILSRNAKVLWNDNERNDPMSPVGLFKYIRTRLLQP